MSSPGRVAVTGASGYLGRAVVDEFVAAGWDVRRYIRCPAADGDVAYDLAGPVDFSGCDAVVHLAWVTAGRLEGSSQMNVDGTRRASSAARHAGARFVFVSSVSALGSPASAYGRSKAAAESEVVASGGLVVRPGLVVDEPSAGLPEALARLGRRLRVVPLPGARRLKVLVATRALVASDVVAAAAGSAPPAISAEPLAVDLAELLGRVTHSAAKAVPVPVRLSLAALRFGGCWDSRIADVHDSLLGLRSSQSAVAAFEQRPPTARMRVGELDVEANTAERLDAHAAVFDAKPEVQQVFQEIHEEFLRLEDRHGSRAGAARIELGSGVFPLSRTDSEVLSSEVISSSAVDLVFDGAAQPFRDRSISTLFLQNVFHHFSSPAEFLAECDRVLVRGGVAILFEPAHGLGASLLYPRLFPTETFDKQMSGWELPKTGAMTDANQALSYIVFIRDRTSFERAFPSLEIVDIRTFTNWPRYLASGGLNFRRILPRPAFPMLKWIEPRLGPVHRVLGLHQFIVLRKRVEDPA